MFERRVIEHALSVYYQDSENPRGMARDLLDQYAHGLAEKIRSLRDSCAYDPNSVDYRKMTGCANLIDPYVPKT